jgi:hypothetical protein
MTDYEEVRGKHFGDEAVRADGRAFVNCTFDKTILVFSGTSPFVVLGGAGCPKVACVEYAETTLMQLATMYEFGLGEIVEDLFKKVRALFEDEAGQEEGQIRLPIL